MSGHDSTAAVDKNEPPQGCSCRPHNADIAPDPCPRKHALTECLQAAQVARLEARVAVLEKALTSAWRLLDQMAEFGKCVDGETFEEAYEAVKAARALTPEDGANT